MSGNVSWAMLSISISLFTSQAFRTHSKTGGTTSSLLSPNRTFSLSYTLLRNIMIFRMSCSSTSRKGLSQQEMYTITVPFVCMWYSTLWGPCAWPILSLWTLAIPVLGSFNRSKFSRSTLVFSCSLWYIAISGRVAQATLGNALSCADFVCLYPWYPFGHCFFYSKWFSPSSRTDSIFAGFLFWCHLGEYPVFLYLRP